MDSDKVRKVDDDDYSDDDFGDDDDYDYSD